MSISQTQGAVRVLECIIFFTVIIIDLNHLTGKSYAKENQVKLRRVKR